MAKSNKVSLSYYEQEVYVRIEIDPERTVYESQDFDEPVYEALKEAGYNDAHVITHDVRWPAISNQVWVVCKIRFYNEGYL